MSDDGLMDGFGAPAAKFERIGDTIAGEVVSVEKRAVTDITTGEVKTFANGDTIYQYVFTIATDRRENADDDGMRRVFAKNKMLVAIREAIKKSGLPRGASTVGGVLKVQHHATEAPKTRGFSPTKLFRAHYTPPAPQSDAGEWDAPQTQTPASRGGSAGSQGGPAKSGGPGDDIPF